MDIHLFLKSIKIRFDQHFQDTHFRKKFGMLYSNMLNSFSECLYSIVQYAIQKFVGCQMNNLINQSVSEIREAFSRRKNERDMRSKDKILKSTWIDTPLGTMLAIADDESLFLLEFEDSRGVEREIARLTFSLRASIVPGITDPLISMKNELEQYFKGNLTEFQTPLFLLGTSFQKSVWDKLMQIPFGETRSYLELAKSIGNAAACRAVAQANGANQLSIIIPCHRIINSNGNLGGYAGGVARKNWLIQHENRKCGHSLFEQ